MSSYINYRYRDPLRSCLSGYTNLFCGSCSDYYSSPSPRTCPGCTNSKCKREIENLRLTLDQNVSYLTNKMYELNEKILSLTKENNELKESLQKLSTSNDDEINDSETNQHDDLINQLDDLVIKKVN